MDSNISGDISLNPFPSHPQKIIDAVSLKGVRIYMFSNSIYISEIFGIYVRMDHSPRKDFCVFFCHTTVKLFKMITNVSETCPVRNCLCKSSHRKQKNRTESMHAQIWW